MVEAKPTDAAAAAKTNKPKGKGKGPQLAFSELDDLFLTTKGRSLRNLQKKLDKIKEQEKLVRKGEIQANADMEQKFASKAGIQAEIKELQELIDLYMKSNPDYANKGKASQITQEDVQRAVTDSLRQVAQLLTLQGLAREDSSFVEGQAEHMKAVCHIAQAVEAASQGSKSFQETGDSAFVGLCAKLAQGGDEKVCEDGSTFGGVADFLTATFGDKSLILQRIADKQLAEQRAAEAETAAA